MHPKYLALAKQFSTNGFHGKTLIEFTNVGEDGLAVGGGSLQKREVTNAHQTHFECSRNWCSAQCEHVYIVTHLFHGLFMLHTKALFFVNNQQTKIFEFNGVLQQAMCANDAIDFTRCERCNNFLCFTCGLKT